MRIIFDMDNTLTDLQGKYKRPDIDILLSLLIEDKHTLILWTNSPKFRAREILKDNDLMKYFSEYIYREDYDPDNRGLNKDIRKINGDIIIDDDPAEIDFNVKNKKRGILVKSYLSSKTEIEKNEYKKIYKEINKKKFFRLFNYT